MTDSGNYNNRKWADFERDFSGTGRPFFFFLAERNKTTWEKEIGKSTKIDKNSSFFLAVDLWEQLENIRRVQSEKVPKCYNNQCDCHYSGTTYRVFPSRCPYQQRRKTKKQTKSLFTTPFMPHLIHLWLDAGMESILHCRWRKNTPTDCTHYSRWVKECEWSKAG